MATNNPQQKYLKAAARRRAEVIKLRRKGYAVADLAEIFGITKQRVYQIIGPQR